MKIKHRYIDKDGKEVIVLEEAPQPIEQKKRRTKAKKFFNNLKRYK